MSHRFVVLGDMVDSRRRSRRGELVERVRGSMEQLARDFAPWLQAPPTATRGIDEFSAVFRSPAGAFDLLVRLNLSLWPIRFRMAAVLGEVDVKADADDAARMDGPAFHAAATAIEKMKADGRTFSVAGESLDPAAAALATALGSAHQTMTFALKKRTIETLQQMYSRAPGIEPPTQDQIARSMKLKSRQAVSDALRRANFETLRLLEDALRQWLATLR